ncbi:uncharacterized protein LOC131186657 [Ahaetulla prasina]|uniref:uncharacterized protein LOC131186657 n=1 Tax=Ahaetulla prasina TaxID=499056 RepID=UPI002647C677|nr:uncharacterized protein LOC131186657 [Ahaetulla prasina]
MEKDKSKTKLPSTSDGIKTQEEADRLVEEETTMRKEVEIFLQEELDKLLAEKEPKERPRKTSQESQLSEKHRAQPKKSKVGVESPTRFEKAGVDEDLLTLLDEPWDIPREPSRGDLEDPWDKLSLLDESMLDLKSLGKQKASSIQEEVEKSSLEEEEEEGERQPLAKKEDRLVEMSTKGGQHLMKPVFLDYLEDEDRVKEGSKHSLWSMRSSIGTIFEQKLQHLQNLKGSIQKRNITSLPFGYFSKSKRLPSGVDAEKEEQPSEESEPRHWIPRFLKKSKPKRIASFRRKSLKKSQLGGDQVTELSKIFSEDFFKSQDGRGSEDIPEEDLPPSPEDIPQQNEEELKQIQEVTKKQEDVPSSLLWPMGKRTSHREMGHSRDFPDSVFKDKAYKQKFAKHERESKVAVPLPLQELIEEEVLAILKATLLAYQKKLGVNHPLTEQMEEQVDKLHLQLQGRGVI